MENTTNVQFANDIAPMPERPQFLKVLCILTWICCGLTFLSSVSSLAMQPSAEQQQQQIEKIREMNPEAAEKMEAVLSTQTPASKMISSLITLVSVVLSAYGAVMMWQLKKTGFYIYVVGEVIPYLGFLFGGAQALSAVGAMAGSMGAAAVGIVMGIMVVFDLAFIIMYAVNLKYMNK